MNFQANLFSKQYRGWWPISNKANSLDLFLRVEEKFSARQVVSNFILKYF